MISERLVDDGELRRGSVTIMSMLGRTSTRAPFVECSKWGNLPRFLFGLPSYFLFFFRFLPGT